MVASAMAGVNCPWLAVEEITGNSPDLSMLRAVDGYEFRRYWGGVGSSSLIARLEELGVHLTVLSTRKNRDYLQWC